MWNIRSNQLRGCSCCLFGSINVELNLFLFESLKNDNRYTCKVLSAKCLRIDDRIIQNWNWNFDKALDKTHIQSSSYIPRCDSFITKYQYQRTLTSTTERKRKKKKQIKQFTLDVCGFWCLVHVVHVIEIVRNFCRFFGVCVFCLAYNNSSIGTMIIVPFYFLIHLLAKLCQDGASLWCVYLFVCAIKWSSIIQEDLPFPHQCKCECKCKRAHIIR